MERMRDGERERERESTKGTMSPKNGGHSAWEKLLLTSDDCRLSHLLPTLSQEKSKSKIF